MLDILRKRAGGFFVPVLRREIEQLGRIVERFAGPVDDVDGALERGPLAPETLRPLPVPPDRGVLQLTPDLGETFALRRDVKDTP